jgi:hypothetical protein
VPRGLRIDDGLPFENDPAGAVRPRRRLALARQARCEPDLGGAGLRQPHDHGLIDGGRKHFAQKDGVFDCVAHAHDGVAEIQLALIVRGAHGMDERQPEIAERLIRRHAPGCADDRLVGKRLRLHGLAFREEPAYFPDRLRPRGVQPIALLASPDGVFIELQPLLFDAAEDHGAESPVADRKRLVPRTGGLTVPEPKIRLRLLHRGPRDSEAPAFRRASSGGGDRAATQEERDADPLHSRGAY